MLLAMLMLLLATGTVLAEDVTVELTGGEIAGEVRGQGTASVIATVTNDGSREVYGVRIAAYYSTVNMPPSDPEAADWRIHEFVFEPPLAPTHSVTLRFSDENAGEYVLLEVRYVSAGLGLSYNGRLARLESALQEHDGTAYVATRDLIGLIGGGISYDAATYEVVIMRQGIELRFKEGSRKVKVDGADTTIEHEVRSEDGSSFLPVSDICPLLGVSVVHDPALNMIQLSD